MDIQEFIDLLNENGATGKWKTSKDRKDAAKARRKNVLGVTKDLLNPRTALAYHKEILKKRRKKMDR